MSEPTAERCVFTSRFGNVCDSLPEALVHEPCLKSALFCDSIFCHPHQTEAEPVEKPSALITYVEEPDGSLCVVLHRAPLVASCDGMDGAILMQIPREASKDVKHAKVIIDTVNAIFGQWNTMLEARNAR